MSGIRPDMMQEQQHLRSLGDRGEFEGPNPASGQYGRQRNPISEQEAGAFITMKPQKGICSSAPPTRLYRLRTGHSIVLGQAGLGCQNSVSAFISSYFCRQMKCDSLSAQTIAQRLEILQSCKLNLIITFSRTV